MEQKDRQMFKATCSKCGSECEVPFQPSEGRKVLCLDCFRQNRPRRDNFSRNNRFRRQEPRQMHKATCSKCGSECEVPFRPTEGKEVLCNDCFRAKKGNQEETDF